MTQFIGEFECRLDAKGRLSLPSGLRKQFAPDDNEKLVINRGFENCLTMYPFKDWQKISNEINQMNMFVKKNRDFARYFFRGAMDLDIDTAGRILLPKGLCEYAAIDKDVILSAWGNKIEIWDSAKFKSMMNDQPGDFEKLAEETMGKVNKGGPFFGLS
jgi:MraZ protein